MGAAQSGEQEREPLAGAARAAQGDDAAQHASASGAGDAPLRSPPAAADERLATSPPQAFSRGWRPRHHGRSGAGLQGAAPLGCGAPLPLRLRALAGRRRQNRLERAHALNKYVACTPAARRLRGGASR